MDDAELLHKAKLITTAANEIRFLRTSELDEISPAMMRGVARLARAASYSFFVTARRLEHRANTLDPDGPK